MIGGYILEDCLGSTKGRTKREFLSQILSSMDGSPIVWSTLNEANETQKNTLNGTVLHSKHMNLRKMGLHLSGW